MSAFSTPGLSDLDVLSVLVESLDKVRGMHTHYQHRQDQKPTSDGETIAEQLSDVSVQHHKSKQQRQTVEFLKGPIPMAWICQASALSSRAALAVGIMLWFRAGCQKRRTDLTVGKALRERFRLGRQAVYGGLAALEAAGLVTVVRLPGQTARISIQHAGEPVSADDGSSRTVNKDAR